jgi:dihydrofolate reductase
MPADRRADAEALGITAAVAAAARPVAHTRLGVIAAVARNGAIGRDNQLLWHLSEDLKFFKRTTLGCPVIMGRRTFDSIGRVLPGRRNIVVTRNRQWQHEGVDAVESLSAALALAKTAGAPKVWAIGGAAIYAEALPLADEVVLTEIDHDFEADRHFPPWDRSAFDVVTHEDHVADAGWPYRHVVYLRRTP